MKTETKITYQISNPGGRVLKLCNDWETVLAWENANEKEHPDWRITRYQVKQIVTIETVLK